MRTVFAALLFVFAAAGCSNGNGYDGGSRCRAAGGNCYLNVNPSTCVMLGPSGCDPGGAPNPGGGEVCCLAFADAGAPD